MAFIIFFLLAEHIRLPPQPTEEHGHGKQGVKAKDQVRHGKKDTKDKIIGCEEQRKIGTVNEFFDQLLFPAFERKCQQQKVTLSHLSWTRDMNFFTWKLV